MVGVLYTWIWDKEQLADERQKKKEDLSLGPWISPLVSPFPGFRILRILWPLSEKLDRWGLSSPGWTNAGSWSLEAIVPWWKKWEHWTQQIWIWVPDLVLRREKVWGRLWKPWAGYWTLWFSFFIWIKEGIIPNFQDYPRHSHNQLGWYPPRSKYSKW